MSLRRPFVQWAWWVALFISGACMAQARMPSSPTRVPTQTLSTRALDSVVIDPTISSAIPRSPTVSIGGPLVSATIKGSQLGSVSAVQVVDSAGTQQSQIEAHINEASRASHTLPLQLFAKKNARPGRYRLRLSLPADPRQIQSRPRGAPFGGAATRTVDVPESAISITVQALEPKITSLAPTNPAHSTPLQPQMTVSELPGSEVVSVTRFQGDGDRYCRYRPDPRAAPSQPHWQGGVWNSSWSAPNTLRVTLLRGEFEPASPCYMRLSIKTRNALGEEFLSITPSFVVNLASPPPRAKIPVRGTWKLKNYLYLPADFGVGVCNGSSIGAHGSIPVGIVNVNGNLGFRIRSGPIGTECHWKIATNKLDIGWALHMNFRIRHIGNKCKTTDGSTPQFDFSRLRSATILSNGEYSLYGNLNDNGNSVKLVVLRCDATLSNDHEVLVEMVSASVSNATAPRSDCDWKCAFR